MNRQRLLIVLRGDTDGQGSRLLKETDSVYSPIAPGAAVIYSSLPDGVMGSAQSNTFCSQIDCTPNG